MNNVPIFSEINSVPVSLGNVVKGSEAVTLSDNVIELHAEWTVINSEASVRGSNITR